MLNFIFLCAALSFQRHDYPFIALSMETLKTAMEHGDLSSVQQVSTFEFSRSKTLKGLSLSDPIKEVSFKHSVQIGEQVFVDKSGKLFVIRFKKQPNSNFWSIDKLIDDRKPRAGLSPNAENEMFGEVLTLAKRGRLRDIDGLVTDSQLKEAKLLNTRKITVENVKISRKDKVSYYQFSFDYVPVKKLDLKSGWLLSDIRSMEDVWREREDPYVNAKLIPTHVSSSQPITIDANSAVFYCKNHHSKLKVKIEYDTQLNDHALFHSLVHNREELDLLNLNILGKLNDKDHICWTKSIALPRRKNSLLITTQRSKNLLTGVFFGISTFMY